MIGYGIIAGVALMEALIIGQDVTYRIYEARLKKVNWDFDRLCEITLETRPSLGRRLSKLESEHNS
jgi:hypothetical protein